MPPTSCLGCGSGRKPLGNRPLSRISSGDMLGQLVPRRRLPASLAAGPTGIGLPRVIFTLLSVRDGQIVALFQECLLPGHDLVLVGLVLGHHALERFLAEEHGADLVVRALRRASHRCRFGLLGGRLLRPGRAGQNQNACHHDQPAQSRWSGKRSVAVVINIILLRLLNWGWNSPLTYGNQPRPEMSFHRKGQRTMVNGRSPLRKGDDLDRAGSVR